MAIIGMHYREHANIDIDRLGKCYDVKSKLGQTDDKTLIDFSICVNRCQVMKTH